MTIAALGSHRATGQTITEQFGAFDAHNPHVYRALERMAACRLAAGATRISLKDLFEDIRRQLPYGAAGLNNNFTALYARRLIDDHPHWADAFELRRRRAA
ncbi:hypothetical protein [Streptomyces sp. PAM3C]|uniref:hypothetical protein n=1 Tax=Streptomyces sp. PAM3C TaxID=2847300 RepID=UPI001C1E1AB9|nr:hypothetical protein [Streptomyces sp. PAM3C]MBU5946442.1 hypothetical protein [Streptomyces sp. PAM3C]